MRRLVLASSSPRRQQLLADAGFAASIVEPEYEEDLTLRLPPAELVKFLSRGKAESVAPRAPDAVIVAGDTIVVHEGRVLGKPHEPARAKEMLRELSGTTHFVITGFTVLDAGSGRAVSDAIEARIFFKTLGEEVIASYVATGEPLDKAGAYAVQGKGGEFIERIEGDFATVVGLPISRLAEILPEFGITRRAS
ncbi:MAG: septum formation inhibitor Maf [Patescibacteria group bacterium]|nr:septum formation inhibitor Maf [Patescibacteria group bacterium]MDE1965685.1 septum formation inhibitor Maf [Patescibacteria group bacterium]